MIMFKRTWSLGLIVIALSWMIACGETSPDTNEAKIMKLEVQVFSLVSAVSQLETEVLRLGRCVERKHDHKIVSVGMTYGARDYITRIDQGC